MAAGAEAAADLGRDLDDEFLGLVYADEELLRREFDDLMAVAWSGRPPSGVGDRSADHPVDHPTAQQSGELRGRLRSTPGRAALARLPRTRSPPIRR